MIYLQTKDDSTEKKLEYQMEEYRLQENDIIDVQIRSMNEEANKLFPYKVVKVNRQLRPEWPVGGFVLYDWLYG